jgi:hypothetical protein
MFKNKKRHKTFKTNEEYFSWFNKNKEQIKILEFKLAKDRIKLSYEERAEEDE